MARSFSGPDADLHVGERGPGWAVGEKGVPERPSSDGAGLGANARSKCRYIDVASQPLAGPLGSWAKACHFSDS